MQMPFGFLPKKSGSKGAVYADAGSLFDYQGPTSNPLTGEINGLVNGVNCKMRDGVRQPDVCPQLRGRWLIWASAVRTAALRLRGADHQGRVRSRAAIQVWRRELRSEVWCFESDPAVLNQTSSLIFVRA